MNKWVDKTSYSRGQRGKIAPDTWELKTMHIRLHVHRHIHYDPDVWLLSTVPSLFNNHELKSRNIEDAFAEAMSLVRGVCEQIKNDLVGCRYQSDTPKWVDKHMPHL